MTPGKVVLGVDAAAGDEEEAVAEGHVVADDAENGKWSGRGVLFLISAAEREKGEEISQPLKTEKGRKVPKLKAGLAVVVVLFVLVHVVVVLSSVSLPEGRGQGESV